MRPLPTLGSPISDKELWQCARHQLDQHGDDAMIVAALKMDMLLEADDRSGYATWAGILLRLAELGPGRREGAVFH